VDAGARIGWRTRHEPLHPGAVLGDGLVAARLAAALAERVEHGADVEVHAGDGLVLAIGDAADLPWVDGAVWLGAEAGLLVPTTLEPTPEPHLVGRAVAKSVGADAGWIVLTPDRIVVGRRAAGHPDPGRLRELARSSSEP
jgi:hypothetical protein